MTRVSICKRFKSIQFCKSPEKVHLQLSRKSRELTVKTLLDVFSALEILPEIHHFTGLRLKKFFLHSAQMFTFILPQFNVQNGVSVFQIFVVF